MLSILFSAPSEARPGTTILMHEAFEIQSFNYSRDVILTAGR